MFTLNAIRYLLLCCICLGAFQVNAQVTAHFQANVNSGCVPTTVRLTNSTLGVATGYYWTFGNGQTSVLSSPSIIYTVPGMYTVTLHAMDASGDTSTYSESVNIYKNPQIRFSAQKVLCEQDIVQFSNQTILGDTGIRTWDWDFGDGNISRSEEPMHQYLNEGVYSVSLVITDSNGCEADTTFFNYITVNPKPESNFSFASTRRCKGPVSVSFYNSSAQANGNSFKWLFGDGGSANTYNTSHIYSGQGAFTVSLVTSNSYGCADTLSISGEIEIAPLLIDFTVPDGGNCVDNELNLKENIQPKLTNATAYNWSIPGQGPRSGKEVSVNLAPGTHKIRLEVVNADCRDTLTKFITVNGLPPNTIEFSDTVICTAGTFLNFSMDSSGIDSFAWFVNNKQTYFKPQAQLYIDEEGPHYFSLFLRDNKGCEVRYTDTVIASFPSVHIGEDTGGCVPYSFKQYLTYSGYSDAVKYVWKYDGQSSDSFLGKGPLNLSYSDTGYYYVDVTVTDELGCVVNSFRSVGAGMKPDIDLNYNKDSICNGEAVALESVAYGSIKPNFFEWRIGSTTIQGQIPAPVLKEPPGTEDIWHRAGFNGCFDTVIVDSAIYFKAPYVKMYTTIDSCFDSRKTVSADIIGADSFWYNINDEFHTNDSVFTKSFSNGDLVRIYAINYETGCLDSSSERILVRDSATLDWFIEMGGCVPMDLKITETHDNLDSIRWFFKDVPFHTNFDHINYTFYSGGEVNFKLRGYTQDCELTLDTSIRAVGPRMAISTVQSPGCLPKTFVLNDSFWFEENTRRYWLVDGDTFESDSLQTKVTVKSVKDPSSNIIVIKLLAGEDSCVSSKQLNYQYPGLRFSTEYTDSITDCDEYLYTFKIFVNPLDSAFVDNYGFFYGNTWKYSSEPVFTQLMQANGARDTIFLNVRSKSGCITTQKIVLNRPLPAAHAQFSSTESESTCPPLYVLFKDQSFSDLGKIAERRWYVEGEFFSKVSNPARIFTLPGMYSISLAVTDEFGCSDSIHIDSFVRIQGEPVLIDFGDQKVCLHDTVKFRVKEGNAVSYEWDMGDGSVLTGGQVNYKYNSAGMYRIIMLITDSMGCTYSQYPDDSLEIVPLPFAEIGFEHNCRNSFTKLQNLGKGTYPLVWNEWETDSEIYSNKDSLEVYTSGTDHLQIVLRVRDSLGCYSETQARIKLYDVQARFGMEEPAYCLGDSVQIIDWSVSDTIMKLLSWFDPDEPIILSKAGKFMASNPGYHDVVQIAENVLGCKDTFRMTAILKIMDPEMSEPDLLKRITVLEDNRLQVDWKTDSSSFFKSYQLFGIGGPRVFTARTDTTYIYSNDASINSLCISMGTGDVCRDLEDSTELRVHCSILANGNPDTMKNCIEWNAYQGWEVDWYYIYRKSGSEWEKIDSVPGTAQTYCDEDLSQCQEYREYFVKAQGEFYWSNSDTAKVKPIWVSSTDPPEILNVSVLADGEMELYLDTAHAIIPFLQFEAERTSMGGGQSSFSIADADYHIDGQVQTQEQFYTYRIRQLDVCKGESHWSAPSTSVWLRIDSDHTSSKPRLIWNHSEVWSDGMSRYEVQRMNEDGEYETIASLNTITDTVFTDQLKDLECAMQSCYRIAVLSTDQQWWSYSNVVCGALESTLFVPNAFTLNHDGLNERFQPRGLYIQDYNLKVYSRWGELIFETEQCMQGWDGKYKGQSADGGVYIYLVQAMGADGKFHIHKGTITVLR